MFDVISIGAATVDIFIKSDALTSTSDFIGLKTSSKNEISHSLICSGGGATNSSVAFSRLGLKSACISLIGRSYLNDYIFDDLKREKVVDKFICSNKNDTTDFSVILVSKDGRRSILTNRGKFGLTDKNFRWSQLKTTKWFYITSLEGNLDLLEKIIGFAKENHIHLALNPGNRELSRRRQLTSLLKYVDFLLLNRTEAEALLDLSFSDAEFFNQLHYLKSPLIAVTDGRNGAYLINDHRQYFSPIISTIPVDETGAGDSFGSAFVAATIYQKSPQEALFWAIKNSASVVTRLGAKAGLLTLKQIKS